MAVCLAGPRSGCPSIGADRRVSAGNPGDHRSVGDGVLELRLTYGPGYRVYYKVHGLLVIVLLAGGDNSTQQADIALAKAVAKQWEPPQ